MFRSRTAIALEQARNQIAAIQKQFDTQAVLISMVTEGSKVRLIFRRNGETHMFETYLTMGVDVNGLRKALLE